MAVVAALGAPGIAEAQLDSTEAWASHLSNTYRVVPNVTYHTANNRDNKVDLYLPRGAEGPTPVLMYIHGGGWVGGSKEGNVLRLLPWLEKGWAVVNVQYRLGRISRAPAAVEDCLCALHWVKSNAEQYGFDASRIVVTGNSAGGHLALTTGMVPGSAGLDLECQPKDDLGVAAIINWYGITDVHDLAHREPGTSGNFTEAWLGSGSDRDDVARRVSPTNYVNGDTPPILTIHGDADSIVPYDHATRLHELLDEWGVANQLITVEGGGHGGFSPEENQHIYAAIRAFLGEHGLGARMSND
jgi:acetyl esterase/lipase